MKTIEVYDFAIEATVRLYDKGSVGIVFRAKNPFNYYLLEFYERNIDFSLVYNGVTYDLEKEVFPLEV